MEPILEMRGITKRFGVVRALNNVNLTVMPAEIHALVGENGAGKSTLMKILYGVQRPDEGTISVGGEPVTLHSPADAIKHGIARTPGGAGHSASIHALIGAARR